MKKKPTSPTPTRNKIKRTAARTAMLMAILTLISKLFGFIREMVMAGFFGTSDITDAYVMAIAIPSIIFLGFFDAINTAYMPTFSSIQEREGSEKGNLFTSESITLSFMIAVVAAVVGFLFSEQITSVFAPGFSGEKAALTANFLRVTFSYALFTSVAGLLEAFLRYKNVFLAQIAVGYAQNIIIIIVIIISAYTSHALLALGWFLAYVVRLLIIWILAKRRDFKYTFTVHLGAPAKRILALSLPVFIGSYINQINVFVDKTLASGLQEGSVAALNYGNTLVSLITSLTVSIIISIVYPKMTKAQALGDVKHYGDMVLNGFNIIYIITVPCTLGAMLYSQQAVQIVYERGAFDTASTALTGTAFFYYSMGILFLALNNFFIQIYYSMYDMKIPVLFGAIGVVVNVTLNLLLVGPMAHGGLALATSIAAASNAALLYAGLRKKYPEITLIKSKKKLLKITLAALLSVAASYAAYMAILQWLTGVIYMRILQLGIPVALACLLYLALLRLMKIEELKFVRQMFGR